MVGSKTCQLNQLQLLRGQGGHVPGCQEEAATWMLLNLRPCTSPSHKTPQDQSYRYSLYLRRGKWWSGYGQAGRMERGEWIGTFTVQASQYVVGIKGEESSMVEHHRQQLGDCTTTASKESRKKSLIRGPLQHWHRRLPHWLVVYVFIDLEKKLRTEMKTWNCWC